MKKFAVLSLCMLYGLKCLIANPIPVPSVNINEIMFDAEKGWMLELECIGGVEFPFVKMTVSSSSGSAESKYLPVWEGEDRNYSSQLFVLTRDSMKSDLDINPLGDAITVVIEFIFAEYGGEVDFYDDVLIFGNHSDSQIAAPFEGQSIGYLGLASYDFYPLYAKTNEPTMGAPNDASKMRGTLTGKVYDKNNQLVLNDSISFDRELYPLIKYIDIDENGSYSINLLANRLSKSHVYMADKQINIKSFTIDIEPDDIMEQDIYLLEDYTDIVEINKMNDFPIRIYPNPLSGGQALQYEIGIPVKSLDCRIEIISMDGRMMFESRITDHTGSINLPHSLSGGMYIANFKLNNKTQYSTRLIIGK